jgi:hypothetical protein
VVRILKTSTLAKVGLFDIKGHEASFMDVPRLSTIQALLLLLKARESSPKKGYFYRSWQTVKTIISMAKDLDLHEHYGIHAEGRPCNLDSIECLIQTRVWQTLLIVEVMVGGPQGAHQIFQFQCVVSV